jgi:hypothetical protein
MKYGSSVYNFDTEIRVMSFHILDALYVFVSEDLQNQENWQIKNKKHFHT